MEFAFKNAHVYKNQKVTVLPEYICNVDIQGGVAVTGDDEINAIDFFS